ncbi:hypothetical protein [Haloglomus irregulare]|jgi:hypothetical protein|nr:hypothetical protein [Haloglomus irregulare]
MPLASRTHDPVGDPAPDLDAPALLADPETAPGDRPTEAELLAVVADIGA